MTPAELQTRGVELEDLAARFGTPLLVLDGAHVTERVTSFLAALAHSPGGRLFYASKALSLTGLVQRVSSLGSGVEVISIGELATALRAGVDPGQILMNGSPKSEDEIDVAVQAGVGTFVLDTWEEIPRLERALSRHRKEADVLVRYTPAEASDTHRYVQTAGLESKFGFLREEVLGAVDQVLGIDRVHWRGLHLHIGSNLKTTDAHFRAGDDAAKLLLEIQGRTGVRAQVLDLGGGFAAPGGGEAPDVGSFVLAMDAHLAGLFGERRPALWLEPGRALVEGAGTLVYKVLAIKERPGGKLLLVDGGMGDNIRPALYGASYDLAIWPSRVGATSAYEVYGRYCESGDHIGVGHFPEVREGDLLFVLASGAYTYSMASNYNRVGRPPVLWVEGGQVSLLARREEADDLLRLDQADDLWQDRPRT